jgi:CheY-like chemotaxis protein/anti-sigma regulatory factor (Ser/Thr protein kinase)
MVEDRARKRGLALSCEIDDAVPNHAELDPEQFRQVVVNLLTNAVKYTNECRIDLVVEPARPDEPGTLAVEVTDTGGGIPDDEQAELFKAFTQVDSSATRVREEVGLGLSIVQELTRLMGGHVTCESTPGEGSTFRFTVEAPPVGSREPPTDSDPFLVAGDDGFEVDRIQALLEAWRIPHLVARDASEVRDVLDASDPRILVVDELLVDRAGGLFLSNLRDQLPETASIVRLGSFPEPSTEAGDATLAKSISAAAFHALLHDPDADLAMPSPDEARQLDPPFEVGDPGLKVLIAEDSPVNQQMLVAMLRRPGHEVQAVDGGSGAVEAVSRDSEIDLVLVDIQMPRMDGYEVTERILDEHGDEALASWPSPPTPTRRPVAAAARRGWRAAWPSRSRSKRWKTPSNRRSPCSA